jgi:hypothetical protein
MGGGELAFVCGLALTCLGKVACFDLHALGCQTVADTVTGKPVRQRLYHRPLLAWLTITCSVAQEALEGEEGCCLLSSTSADAGGPWSCSEEDYEAEEKSTGLWMGPAWED